MPVNKVDSKTPESQLKNLFYSMAHSINNIRGSFLPPGQVKQHRFLNCTPQL